MGGLHNSNNNNSSNNNDDNKLEHHHVVVRKIQMKVSCIVSLYSVESHRMVQSLTLFGGRRVAATRSHFGIDTGGCWGIDLGSRR